MIPSNNPFIRQEQVHGEDDVSASEGGEELIQNTQEHFMGIRQPRPSLYFERQPVGDAASFRTLNNVLNMGNFENQSFAPLQRQQNYDMTLHDAETYMQHSNRINMTSSGSATNMTFQDGIIQNNALSISTNRGNIQQEPSQENILFLMSMANRPANNSWIHSQRFGMQGDNNVFTNDAEMLRAYNHELSQAIMASSNYSTAQGFGVAPSAAPNFLDSMPHPMFPNTRHLINTPPSTSSFFPVSATTNIDPNSQFHPNQGLFRSDISDRIEPSNPGNVMLGQSLMDHFDPHPRRILDLDLGDRRSLDLETRKLPARKKSRPHRKKPIDMPRRPLSAYNLFFSSERERILKEIEMLESGVPTFESGETKDSDDAEACQALQRPLVLSEVKRRPHRKTHGKIGFRDLARMVGRRWKQLSVEQKRYYQELADEDMLRHKIAMEEYFRKQSEEESQLGQEDIDGSQDEPTHQGTTTRSDSFENLASVGVEKEVSDVEERKKAISNRSEKDKATTNAPGNDSTCAAVDKETKFDTFEEETITQSAEQETKSDDREDKSDVSECWRLSDDTSKRGSS
jgi:HMG (high mobility group) box